MPVAVAVPLIAAGIGAGVSALGARQQAKGTERAADLQAQGSREALDFTRGEATRDQKNFEATQKANYDQYIAQQQRNRPYQQLGASAAGTLQRRLGLPDVQLPANPAPPVYQGMNNSAAMPQGVPIADLGGRSGWRVASEVAHQQAQGMTTLRAPDGSTEQVPAAQVPWWLQRGATVVPGGQNGMV